MIIFRTKPASITFEGTLIFPGVQFISDERFDYLKTRYPDFAKETEGGRRAFIQVLVKPSEPVTDGKTKVKAWPKAKTNLGEEILALDEDEAVGIIADIIDEKELKDVQVADTRRKVRAACERQWSERAAVMARLAPRATVSPNMDVVKEPIYSTDDPIVKSVVKEMAEGR